MRESSAGGYHLAEEGAVELKAQTFTYQGELPALNEILDAKRRVSRHSRWNRYNEWKQEQTEKIVLQANMQRIDAVEVYPVRLSFLFYAKDRRKDPDNIVAGGVKMMLDGLKAAGILSNDGWKELVASDGTTGAAPVFRVDAENPRVVVLIEEMCG